MRPFARRCTAVVTLLLLLSSTLVAQTPPSFRAGETIEVSVVNVDVFVTDKQGNRVRGLKRGDFEIYENGKLQPISNFAEYRGSDERVAVSVDGPAATTPVPDAPAAREKRTVVIFYELASMPRHVIDPLVTGIRTAVRQLVGPQDSVSFVVWSKHSSRFIEFTNDLEQIDAALDIVAKAARAIEVNETMQILKELESVAMFEARMAAMAAGAGAPQRGTSAADLAAAAAANVAGSAGVNLSMSLAYSEMQKRVAAINSAITTLGGVEGKKILLLVPRRLGEVAGAESVYISGASRIPEPLRQRYNTVELMKTMVQNANANGVTIYPIYPPGLTTTLVGAESETLPPPQFDYLTLQNEAVSMREVAKQTGGISGTGVKDIVELLPRIVDDANDYYSLGYRATAANADRARDVVVKVRNRDLTVRSRRQHVEKSDETKTRDRLISALFRADNASEMPIRARLTSSAIGARKAPVEVRVPISALTVLPQDNGKHAGAFSVYVGAAADLGEISDITKKTQPFEIEDAKLQEARAGHFTYQLDVNVNEKARYLAVAVVDEVGRTWGVTRLDLHNPPTQ